MKNRGLTAFLATLFFVASRPLFAQGPLEFNYQGKLANADGTPRNGSHSMTFTIYDNSAGSGGALYTGSDPTVSVTNGVFNVIVGRDTAALPVSIFRNNADLWMKVTVGVQDLAPLQKLVSTPYALSVAPQAISSTEVANGTLLNEDLHTNADIDPSKINDGGSFQSGSTFLFPGASAIGIATNTAGGYQLNVQGDINFTGGLFEDGVAAVFSNWTRTPSPTFQNLYRNSRVAIGTTTTPAYTLDVNGDVNIRTPGTLRIDGNQAVFSKWSDADSPLSAIFRANQVGVGTAVPTGVGLPDLTFQFQVFDDDNTNTLALSQNNGARAGPVQVGFCDGECTNPTGGTTNAALTGFYAVYAP